MVPSHVSPDHSASSVVHLPPAKVPKLSLSEASRVLTKDPTSEITPNPDAAVKQMDKLSSPKEIRASEYILDKKPKLSGPQTSNQTGMLSLKSSQCNPHVSESEAMASQAIFLQIYSVAQLTLKA